MRILTLLAFALSLAPALASADACSPDSWTADEALFEHLAVEDFQGYPESYWSDIAQSAPMIVGDAGIWGTAWTTTGWCIPGMDNGGSCGGDNVYLASAVDLRIDAQAPFSQIGFRYGTQGQDFHIEITLSDGSVRVFSPYQPQPNAWGGTNNYGFFGYCTGDDSLSIVHVRMWSADGGIDDLRTGNSPGPACSLDSISDDIVALGLSQNKAHPLLVKVDQVFAMLEKGKPCQALNALDQLAHRIVQWREKFIPADAADALLDCIDAIAADLDGQCG